ncbi:MAG: dihydroorotase [Saprospiraceae bacterium]
MQLLLRNVRICSEKETTAPTDIRVGGGYILAVGKNLPTEPGVREIHFEQQAYASPGWMDVGALSGEPGYEHREDLRSLAAAAAAGGFTALAPMPNTLPVADSKSGIAYLLSKTAGDAVRFFPIGALSVGAAGKDMAELYDMHATGAVAFSDGPHPVQDAGLLLRALQYAQAFDGLVFDWPHHKGIAGGGMVHEGFVSTRLGMKAIPALAEEVSVQRDLSLLEYAGGRLHLHLLSTKKGVEMVRAAKAAGQPVTASVAIANLCFTDDNLAEFDSQWKVLPPLRSAEHQEALLEGIADGTIDFLCTNHAPWDPEAKNLEFPYAEFGMIGLETAFALCSTFLEKKLSLHDLVRLWAVGPRHVLGLPVPEIKPGAPAEITLLAPDMPWTFTTPDIRSRSVNTPFVGQAFRGKVLGIVRGEQVVGLV